MNSSRFPSRLPAILAVVSLASLLFLAGCDTGPPIPDTYTVTGTVTYQGQPVEGADVLFARDSRDIAKGEMAMGKTGADGSYTLTTRVGPQTEAEGATPGEYEVTVSKFIPPDGMTEEEYQAMVAEAEKIAATGEMVPEDKNPPQKTQMLPEKYSVMGKSELKASVTADGANTLNFELE